MVFFTQQKIYLLKVKDIVGEGDHVVCTVTDDSGSFLFSVSQKGAL